MTAGPTVLIAAVSGRALAQSARRAGYVPLVADAFGDLDTRSAAFDLRVIPEVMERGFYAKSLVAALDALCSVAPTPPLGVVLGSGLEDKPRLWALLHRRYGVLGCSAESVRHTKDPQIFFSVLDELNIPHPETQINPPDGASEWLCKRIGGAGGRHIRYAANPPRAEARYYFQKLASGERISVHSVVAADGISSSLSRQWCAPSAAYPFRYGGAVVLLEDTAFPIVSMLATITQLARGLDLRGAISADFIIENGVPLLLEINPRPGATVDIFDDESGTLFAAHIDACRGRPVEPQGGELNLCKAAALLYADKGAIKLGKFDWPEWSADRGAAGTLVPEAAPLATVFAEAATADLAEALARARLAELESLIYEHSTA